MNLTKKEIKLIENMLTKTLHAYEDLIADPEGEIGKWKGYGIRETCRLCKVSEEITKKKNSCEVCPIVTGLYYSNRVKDFIGTCGSAFSGGSLFEMFESLKYYFNKPAKVDLLKVVDVAKCRLRALRDAAAKNGWDYY